MTKPGYFCADASTQLTIRVTGFRTLQWALDEVKLQDFFYPILGVSSLNPEGGALAWDFFKTNFAQVRVHV